MPAARARAPPTLKASLDVSAAPLSESGTQLPRPPLPGSGMAFTGELRERLMLAIAQHQRGDLSAAIAGYQQVLQVNPRLFDALRLLGAALAMQERLDEAVEQLDRALNVRDDFAEVWAVRGDALARQQ